MSTETIWELWQKTFADGACSERLLLRGDAASIASMIEAESSHDYEDGVRAELLVRVAPGDGTKAADWLADYRAEARREEFWQKVAELGLDARFGHPAQSQEDYDSLADCFKTTDLTFEGFVDRVFALCGDVVLKREDLARERYILNSFLARAEKLVKARNLEPMHLAKYRVKTGHGDGDFVLRFVEWIDRWTPEGEAWNVPTSIEGGELIYSYAAPVHLGDGEHILSCRVSNGGMTKIPADILPDLQLEERRGIFWIEAAVFKPLDGIDTRGIYCVMSDRRFIDLFGLGPKPSREFIQCWVDERGRTLIPAAVMERVGIPAGGGVMYLRELDGKTILMSDAAYVKEIGFAKEDEDE